MVLCGRAATNAPSPRCLPANHPNMSPCGLSLSCEWATIIRFMTISVVGGCGKHISRHATATHSSNGSLGTQQWHSVYVLCVQMIYTYCVYTTYAASRSGIATTEPLTVCSHPRVSCPACTLHTAIGHVIAVMGRRSLTCYAPLEFTHVRIPQFHYCNLVIDCSVQCACSWD